MLNIPQNKLNSAVEALQTAGLFISDTQIITATHDKLYRIGTTDKPKSKDGWFKVLYDGAIDFVTICYGNWVTQLSDKYHINLKDSNHNNRTQEERKQLQAQINAKIKADHIKREKQTTEKRIHYTNEYSNFNHCHSHPYLTRKCIQYTHHYQLRIDTRSNKNVLCIPFMNQDGIIQGYQAITADGDKRFRGGSGGFYWQYPLTNPCPDVFDASNTFYILCEGIATGLSAYEAITDYFDADMYLPIVLCAFNAGNLHKVITATKAHKLPYLLLVDNDSTKPRNAGIETAKMLLQSHPDCEIYPLTFTNGDDANDYIIRYGGDSFIQLLGEFAQPILNKIRY